MEDVLKSLRERVSAEESAKSSGMEVHSTKVVTVTAKELKKACDSNPSHPVAKVYLKAIKGFTRKGIIEDTDLHIDAVDLQALLDNKKVEVKTSEAVDEEDSQTYTVRSKVLGEALETPKAETKVKTSQSPTTSPTPPTK